MSEIDDILRAAIKKNAHRQGFQTFEEQAVELRTVLSDHGFSIVQTDRIKALEALVEYHEKGGKSLEDLERELGTA